MLNSLQEKELLADDAEETALTTKGRIVVTDRIADVNAQTTFRRSLRKGAPSCN